MRHPIADDAAITSSAPDTHTRDRRAHVRTRSSTNNSAPPDQSLTAARAAAAASRNRVAKLVHPVDRAPSDRETLCSDEPALERSQLLRTRELFRACRAPRCCWYRGRGSGATLCSATLLSAYERRVTMKILYTPVSVY